MAHTLDSDPGQILEQAKAGDEAALGALLERYRRYLHLLARINLNRRLQAKLDASDVVQEAYLGAYRDFPKFRGATEQEFTGWLRQVLANVIANTVRHYEKTQQRDVRLERQLVHDLNKSSVAMNLAFAGTSVTPSQVVSRREMGVLLAEALHELPHDQREVLVLRHFEELTFPLVAERMNRSVDSVKKLWPRALAHLRQIIRERWHESEQSETI